jgi:hypothetical protein
LVEFQKQVPVLPGRAGDAGRGSVKRSGHTSGISKNSAGNDRNPQPSEDFTARVLGIDGMKIELWQPAA